VPWRWRRELPGSNYQNVYIDTHSYQCFSKRDKRHGVAWHLKRATHAVPRILGRMLRHHPLIVGEWSLALSSETVGTLTPGQIETLNRAYAAAQLLAFSHTQAWFFWSYKTEHGGAWSLRDCMERGWLPEGPKLEIT
jgi:glucan 1,3-beta-glucosidase